MERGREREGEGEGGREREGEGGRGREREGGGNNFHIQCLPSIFPLLLPPPPSPTHPRLHQVIRSPGWVDQRRRTVRQRRMKVTHVHHSGTRKDCSWTCRQGREEDMTQEREKERKRKRREGSKGDKEEEEEEREREEGRWCGEEGYKSGNVEEREA